MLGWEQVPASKQLHAYSGHDPLPVCGEKSAERIATDSYPRTTYSGPMPPPSERICDTCRTWERDHDPMFLAGRDFERRHIAKALTREANRIYNAQDREYPSNVLDVVAANLSYNWETGEYEELSRPR